MYYLTIEVEDDNHPKLYKAKAWVKPWENFKCLEEFKPMEQPFISRDDLGVKQGKSHTSIINSILMGLGGRCFYPFQFPSGLIAWF